jgi:selenoprotein W-related protein
MTEDTLSLKPKKYDVAIEYCVPCDYSDHALQVSRELISHYQHVIDTLTLVTGSKGVFEVTVDGNPIFSKKALDRHPKPGEVLQQFKEVVGPNVAVYGA